jgi:alpha-L-rhamnosidase
MADPWHGAVWIAMPATARRTSAPMFRRQFELPTAPESAVLRICGLGCFEAWCNGQRVGDHLLDPAQTDYERRVFYVEHDVTNQLQRGRNALGVIVGDGWFNQNRVWPSIDPSYGEPRLIAALELTFPDRSRRVVTTGPDWLCARSPITSSNLYAGECYDARLERDGWSEADHDESDWLDVITIDGPGGRLVKQPMPPMRAIEERTPVEITELRPGAFIVDMGQNFAGWARLRITGRRGTTVATRFAETLDEQGELDTASAGVFATDVEQIDRYTCRGEGTETWQPRFTYHGFRYVEVTGFPGRLTADDLVGVVVHTDLPVAGGFECDAPMLNRLHEMALWTHRSNIHGLPEDCPARERCGWLGDANVVAEMSMWNFRGKSFWMKYLDDIETTRARYVDQLPAAIAPGRRAPHPANPDWAAAFILVPWYVFVHYGDEMVLRDHEPGMHRLIHHFAEQADGWILPGGYGDWFDPGGDAFVSSTPPTVTTTMWFLRCARVMAKVSDRLGRPSLAAQFTEWAGRIHVALIDRFFDPAMGSFGSQAADAMALRLGASPVGQEQRIADALAHDIRQRQTHLNVGIMGVRFIFEALSRFGYGDLTLELLLQTTYPSLGNLIERGATTLWEWWGEPEFDIACGPRSMNHPMFAGYDNWFFNTLGGIEPTEDFPGFERFTVTPLLPTGLAHVSVWHESPRGRIEAAYQRHNRSIQWRLIVPPDSAAQLTWPGEEPVDLGPGEHQGEHRPV